jgi:hypothetical protein
MSSSSSNEVHALPPLLDVDGTPLTPESLDEKLRNKRVAYYFAAGWYVFILFQSNMFGLMQGFIDSLAFT